MSGPEYGHRGDQESGHPKRTLYTDRRSRTSVVQRPEESEVLVLSVKEYYLEIET